MCAGNLYEWGREKRRPAVLSSFSVWIKSSWRPSTSLLICLRRLEKASRNRCIRTAAHAQKAVLPPETLKKCVGEFESSSLAHSERFQVPGSRVIPPRLPVGHEGSCLGWNFNCRDLRFVYNCFCFPHYIWYWHYTPTFICKHTCTGESRKV